MTADPFESVTKAWDWFHIQNLVARNFNRTLATSIGPSLSNPLLEWALANLLTVNLASLLDDALESYVTARNIPVNQGRLFDRIEALHDARLIANAPALHLLRKARNECAHTPPSFGGATQPKWHDLDLFIGEVASVLRDDLRMLAPPIKYEWFAERNPILHDEGDVAVTHQYRFGVKRNDKEAFVSTQTIDFLRFSASDRAPSSE
jgi:hypothetical protein